MGKSAAEPRPLPFKTSLPVDSSLPSLRAALDTHASVILVAPPGAGKTTRVPLSLLHAEWRRGGRLLLLEPRRIAARMAARFMAAGLKEPVGETVGYRTRLDSRVGPGTQIEVITEGILIRFLQRDPALPGVAAVIFDEFHERSLNADLGMALSLDVQGALRPDLKLLVMSATLDSAAVASLLGGAPVVVAEGRSFPVATHYLSTTAGQDRIAHCARAVYRAVRDNDGDVLVFLPGIKEIRQVEKRLTGRETGHDFAVQTLHGSLAPEHQDRVLRPPQTGDLQRVILASAVAESSLTVDGVRVVVDSGLMRVPRFDPATGMTRLVTLPVSRSSADQRRGRAGRQGPGVCYRLWSKGQHRSLVPGTPAEITSVDMAPLVLELAAWGVTEPADLVWIDAPPEPAWHQARDVLCALGALDTQGRITPDGARMAELGAHPRLAHMLLWGREHNQPGLACDLAALLETRDPLRGADGDADISLRIDALRSPDSPATAQVRRAATRWRKRLGVPASDARGDPGDLLCAAYPERIAMRRGENRYRLRHGGGAQLFGHQRLSGSSFLVIPDLNPGRGDAQIRLAADVDEATIRRHFAPFIATREDIGWDAVGGRVVARWQEHIDAVSLGERKLDRPDPERVLATLLEGVKAAGLACLPWTPALLQWRARVRFAASLADSPPPWPDLGDAWLSDHLPLWLGPFCRGMSSLAQIKRVDLGSALRARIDWQQSQQLDELAPERVTVPSGSRIRLDYQVDTAAGETPTLAVKLQEMFGAAETPRVGGGRVPVTLHFLSPAGRPVQITRDLASFWQNTYPQVRKDLRGRYPRHPWPEDPLTAAPTGRTKPR